MKHYLLLILFALLLQGCQFPKFKLKFTQFVLQTQLGNTVDSGIVFRNTDASFPTGLLKVSGSITPVATSASAVPLPSKLRFIVTHKDARKNTIAAVSFDANLNSDGTIPGQSFPVAWNRSKRNGEHIDLPDAGRYRSSQQHHEVKAQIQEDGLRRFPKKN